MVKTSTTALMLGLLLCVYSVFLFVSHQVVISDPSAVGHARKRIPHAPPHDHQTSVGEEEDEGATPTTTTTGGHKKHSPGGKKKKGKGKKPAPSHKLKSGHHDSESDQGGDSVFDSSSSYKPDFKNINNQIFYPANGAPGKYITPPKYGYLMIISNEDFVDGALALGTSLRDHSPFLQKKKAHLVILVASGRLGDDSKFRLRYAGFDRIVEVQSLAPRAPGAYWKDTYDKLYMFNLTAYEKLVFMDSDMLNIRSADDLFAKDYGGSKFVGAIGSHSSAHTYFQTGMMVLVPSTAQFDIIIEEFEGGVPPRGKHYNAGMGGRDGVLLRNVFKGNFKSIDDKYSRNLDPRKPFPKSLRSLHFRGKHKPWFNKLLPNADPQLGKKEFGYAYYAWWRLFDRIHRQSPEYLVAYHAADADTQRAATLELPVIGATDDDAVGEQPTPEQLYAKLTKQEIAFGNKLLKAYALETKMEPLSQALSELRKDTLLSEGLIDEAEAEGSKIAANFRHYDGGHSIPHPGVTPLTHYWMMRHTKRQYIQYTAAEDHRLRDAPLPYGTRYVVSRMGHSCDKACSTISRGTGGLFKCDEDLLYHSNLQDCEFVTKHLGCNRCEPSVYWKAHPGNDFPSKEEVGEVVKGTKGVCKLNMLVDERSFPTCAAFNATVTRLCPCYLYILFPGGGGAGKVDTVVEPKENPTGNLETDD